MGSATEKMPRRESQEASGQDVSGGPVVENPPPNARGHGFDPQSGN